MQKNVSMETSSVSSGVSGWTGNNELLMFYALLVPKCSISAAKYNWLELQRIIAGKDGPDEGGF
jgi:hypothetical protein